MKGMLLSRGYKYIKEVPVDSRNSLAAHVQNQYLQNDQLFFARFTASPERRANTRLLLGIT